MRLRHVVVLLSAAALAAPAAAQSFLGTWTATATTPGGEITEEVTATQEGEGYAVTGKLIGASVGGPEAGAGYDVKLEGDSFSYERSVVSTEGELAITYEGTVEGDKFTGSATIRGFAPVPYNGVRKQEGE